MHRSIDYETRIERYQLTAGAHQAVQQIRSVRRHSSTATQSALAMVMAELRQVAVEASPDPARCQGPGRRRSGTYDRALPSKPFSRLDEELRGRDGEDRGVP